MIRLLHAEDDADIREIAMMSLELAGGFEVLQCASGEEAVAQAVAFRPDVLLLDMMMPGMTGCQALEKMRGEPTLGEVPVIFMTARAQHSEIEELLHMGAAKVISKPFDPMALPDQIKAAMQKTRETPDPLHQAMQTKAESGSGQHDQDAKLS